MRQERPRQTTQVFVVRQDSQVDVRLTFIDFEAPERFLVQMLSDRNLSPFLEGDVQLLGIEADQDSHQFGQLALERGGSLEVLNRHQIVPTQAEFFEAIRPPRIVAQNGAATGS